MSGVCGKVRSWLSKIDPVEGAIVTSVAATSWWLVGPLATIVSLGTYLAGRNRVLASELVAVRQQEAKPSERSAIPDGDDEKSAAGPLKVDAPLQGIDCPIPRFTNDGNCCFLSAMLWSMLNDPHLLRELPASIERRLKPNEIFNGDINRLCANLSTEKVQILINIHGSLKGTLNQGQLFQLLRYFQDLEKLGFPKQMVKAKELFSLLELYAFLAHCQTSKTPIHGSLINKLRPAIRRVNSAFEDIGTQVGDANEAFLAFADLIYTGSKVNRTQVTNRICKPNNLWFERRYRLRDDVGINPETGESQSQEQNWGRFEIEVVPGQSLQQTLNAHLASHDPYDAPYWADDKGPLKRSFKVIKESRYFDRPPEFLAIQVKRFKFDLLSETAFKIGDKINAEESISLDKGHIQNGTGTMYKLFSVVNHHGKTLKSGHYTAEIKRGNMWYHCNDVGTSVEPNGSAAAANTGYMLFYRKI